METATKALLIAAGVLIGILILTLGVTLFTNLNTYVESANEKIRFSDINKFNTEFINFINTSSESGEEEFKLTIQDVVTVANFAYDSNCYYNPEVYTTNPDEVGNPETMYVEVFLNGSAIEENIKERAPELLRNNLMNEYKCTDTDVKFSETTGRVYQIYFWKK